MRRFRLTATALTTIGFLLSSMATARAVHADVIVEKIPASSVSIALETVADGFTSPAWALRGRPDCTRRDSNPNLLIRRSPSAVYSE